MRASQKPPRILAWAKLVGMLSEEAFGAVRVSGGVDGRYIDPASSGCQRPHEGFLTLMEKRMNLPLASTGDRSARLTADTVRIDAAGRTMAFSMRCSSQQASP